MASIVNQASGTYVPTTCGTRRRFASDQSRERKGELLTTATSRPGSSRNGSGVYGLNMPGIIAPNTDKVGAVWAISVETGKTLWKYEQRAGVMSLVATGGGLVFGGDVAGNFRALDDKTGEVLWETNIGSPVSGYPISFAVDGKQYVAVTTGPSLVAMAARRMTPELPSDSGSGQVVVFALP